VGEMFTAVRASKAIARGALARIYGPRDQYFDPIATAAKHFVAEQAIKIGLAAMNLHGGEGYMRQHPWERYMRDALGLTRRPGRAGAAAYSARPAGDVRDHPTATLEDRTGSPTGG
jgi:alkylation response protein AidB-like acyl-CoA dehydrogenase